MLPRVGVKLVENLLCQLLVDTLFAELVHSSAPRQVLDVYELLAVSPRVPFVVDKPQLFHTLDCLFRGLLVAVASDFCLELALAVVAAGD